MTKTKYIITLSISLVVLAVVLFVYFIKGPVLKMRQTKEDHDFVLELEDGEYTIVDLKMRIINQVELAIPEEIDGIKVTKICVKNDIGFSKFRNLEKIILPKTIKEITHESFFETKNPFLEAMNLKEIIVDENNPYLCSVKGILYSKNLDILYKVPARYPFVNGEFTILDSVKKIESYACYNLAYLEKVVFPSSLEIIESHAFYNSSSLKEISFSSSLKEIRAYAFSKCHALTKVLLPNSLVKIANGAFSECKELVEVFIPDTVIEFGVDIFILSTKVIVKTPYSNYDALCEKEENLFGKTYENKRIEGVVNN